MGRLRALLDELVSRSGRAVPGKWKARLHQAGWTVALREAGSELEGLNKAAESEFLTVGEKLQQYCFKAREIAKMASSVASLMSGTEISGVIDGFRTVLEDVKGLEGESRQSTEALQRVLDILDTMHAHLEGFRQTARVLRVLCVSTRIESARLGARDIGFSTLAGDVDKLASEIEQKCAHLIEHSESLGGLIRQALARVAEIEARLHGQARVILDSVMSSLMSLTERHGASSTGVKQASIRYDAISRSIGEIVASMQFHDITRQRIEHVREALDEACDGYDGHFVSEGESEGNGAERGQAQLRLLSDVCDLQRAQLSHARHELTSAVQSIIGNLRSIAHHVADISEQTQEMVGAADELGRSFLTEIETGFSSAASALSGYSDACRELYSAMESVGATLRDMSVYARDIEGIGTKIKLIALNAIVKSCHIGEEGAALGVLAEAIHRLSVETCDRTTTVCESFKNIIAAADSLSVGSSLQSGAIAEVDRMAARLDELMSSLKSVNSGIVSLLTRMDEEGRALSEDIMKSAGEIHAHEVIGEAIDNMVTSLEEIVGQSLALLPVEDRIARGDRLKALEASYTMQGERDIHNSVVVGAIGAAISAAELDGGGDIELFGPDTGSTRESASDAEEASREAHALGDNVDLFGLDEGSGEQKPEGKEQSSGEEDLGDNVELF